MADLPIDPNVAGALLVLTCMLVEWAVGRARGRSLYRMGDSLSDLACTLGQLVLQAMLGFSTLSLYGWLQQTFGWFVFPAGGLGAWLAAWMLMELAFYWRHRAGHELRLFWCIHEVHHQSPEYNLAVAQRVGYLQWAQTAVFVLPLAILGIPLPMFAVLFAAIHFYQFLIHTQLVGTLGPLEHVLMTPSHHRVHHGRNPRYLDRNYGFTIVLWDHVFGTFQAETEPVAYGTLQPLRTFNPLDNNLRPWVEMVQTMRSAPGIVSALGVLFRHPAWNPQSRAVELPERTAPPAPRMVPVDVDDRSLRVGVLVLFVAAAVAGLVLVAFHTTWATPWRVLVGLAVFASTALVGQLGHLVHT